MSYTIHQILRTCLEFGMSEQERDAFERRLRFPHVDPSILEHPKFTSNLYIKLRDIGLDDDQVSEVLGAMQ